MMGWTILFALIAVTGGALTFTAIQSTVLTTASLLFFLLFVVFVLTRLVRDRAR
jgi:uncharacterized membrane protein YtjA (UPF0391 family)